MQRGEEMVMGKCFLCHGATGDSSSPLYPKLAGQNEAYLLKQLRNFKTGERESSDMRKIVADMDENDMRAQLWQYWLTGEGCRLWKKSP